MTNQEGRFGIHGGQYVPETLMNVVAELEEAYNQYKNDPEFNKELAELFNEYAGRPSRLYYAKKMTRDLGEQRSILNVKISIIQERTKSIMCLVRHFSQRRWERPVLLPRRELASMVLRQQRQLHSWGWNV